MDIALDTMYSVEVFLFSCSVLNSAQYKMFALYLTAYSSTFSVGDSLDIEMTHNQLNVKKKKPFE